MTDTAANTASHPESGAQADGLTTAKARVAELERQVRASARKLDLVNAELRGAIDDLNGLHRVMPNALIVVDDCGRITRANPATFELVGGDLHDLIGKPIDCIRSEPIAHLSDTPEEDQLSIPPVLRQEEVWTSLQGEPIPVLVSASMHQPNGIGGPSIVLVAVDLRDRRRLEIELRHAQKMEAIGSLAAGVAHEINTPMQFIGDNVHFLNEGFRDVLDLVALYEQLEEEHKGSALLDQIAEAKEVADLDYLRDRVPRAFERTLSGIDRVAAIVAAMKAFSHPDDRLAPADINRLVETALTVGKSEYKYVADVALELGELPMVTCYAGDISQVVLNLVVNAGHALADVHDGCESRGTIRVTTRQETDAVVLTVEDNGCGIPEAVQHRIFDPFFTTKEVGKGTGQGLSMARSVVVDKHSGSLTFETKEGAGTVFTMRLPVAVPQSGRAA